MRTLPSTPCLTAKYLWTKLRCDKAWQYSPICSSLFHINLTYFIQAIASGEFLSSLVSNSLSDFALYGTSGQVLTAKGTPLIIDVAFSEFTLNEVQDTLFNSSCTSCSTQIDDPIFELEAFNLFEIFRDPALLSTSFEMDFSLDVGGLEANFPPIAFDINRTDSGGLIARIEVVWFACTCQDYLQQS